MVDYLSIFLADNQPLIDYFTPLLVTPLLPIIAGRIQIGTTSPKVASQVSQIRYNYFQLKVNGRNTQQAFKICGHY